jgi:MipA family protein
MIRKGKIRTGPVLALACLATAPALQAQETHRWSVGGGAAVVDSPFAGEDTRVIPYPLVTYEGERFFFRGIGVGARLFSTSSFRVDGLLQARLQGWDADDLGLEALAVNGVDRTLLEDRDHSADAGLQFTSRGSYGDVQLQLLADVTDASRGYEARLDYTYGIEISPRFQLRPGASVSWLSDDMANYYFGLLDEEVERGLSAYRPDAVVIPSLSVGAVYTLTKSWTLTGAVSYSLLPDEIEDSPLIDSSQVTTFRLGLLRTF